MTQTELVVRDVDKYAFTRVDYPWNTNIIMSYDIMTRVIVMLCIAVKLSERY